MPTKRTASAPTKRNPKLVFTLQVACNALGIPNRRKLRAWAAVALRRHAHVTVRIVGAREGRTLNKAFRSRDYATNVLTFVYDEGKPLSGDIALCAPVVAREARSQAKPLDAHYAHLLVHGLLHLQGHDHENEDDAEAMEAKEITILKRLGFPNPYHSTAA
jgi:probable rRNA maturation factor